MTHWAIQGYHSYIYSHSHQESPGLFPDVRRAAINTASSLNFHYLGACTRQVDQGFLSRFRETSE